MISGTRAASRFLAWMLVIGLVGRAGAVDRIDSETLHFFGVRPETWGTPLLSPVEGPGGMIYGVTRRTEVSAPDIIYRWSPVTGVRELVARVEAVTGMTRDGDLGLFVSTGTGLHSVSTSGVVRQILAGWSYVNGGIELQDGLIYGMLSSGTNGTGRLYRVRRDGSDMQVIWDFPGYPYGPVGWDEFGIRPLHRDQDGGFTGILTAGYYTVGGWPPGGGGWVEFGNSAVFRVAANGAYSMAPIPSFYTTDVFRRPDGTFAVLSSVPGDYIAAPRILHRLTANGGSYSVQYRAPDDVSLVAGAVMDPDGSIWAVSAPTLQYQSSPTPRRAIVKFPPPPGPGRVETFPIPVETDPLFTHAVGGLIRVGENLYGHCRSPDTGGCLYRVTPSGAVERVVTFDRYPVMPIRVAVHGPVVLANGTVVIPSQEPAANKPLQFPSYRPPDASWEEGFGTVPEVGSAAFSNSRFGVIPGRGATLWILEDVNADGWLSVRVRRLSTDTGASREIGVVRPIGWEGNHWSKHPTLASDGRWYAVDRAGDSSVSPGLLYRFGEETGSLQIFRRFTVDGAMGKYPTGKLIEAEPGWLHGTVAVAPGNAPGGAVFRIRLDGTGFEALAGLPGEVIGGLMEARDGLQYVFVKVAGDGAGMVLMRKRAGDRQMEEFARWPASEFGDLLFDSPPVEGPDRRFYATGYRVGGTNPGVLASVGPSGADPRVDMELSDQVLGVRFVPPLAVGPSGWMYAATQGGGVAGHGGVFRFRQRLDLRSNGDSLEVQTYPGARVRIESAADPGGRWMPDEGDVPLDENGRGASAIDRSHEHRFFRAVLRELE